MFALFVGLLSPVSDLVFGVIKGNTAALACTDYALLIERYLALETTHFSFLAGTGGVMLHVCLLDLTQSGPTGQETPVGCFDGDDHGAGHAAHAM